MFQEMKKHIKNEKGLTLIELLAVIVILAIIAAIAIPAIGNIIGNSREKAILSEALNIVSGAKIAHMDGQCDGNTCKGSVLNNYVDGIELTDANATVTLSGNDWEITYTELTKIPTTSKFSPGTGGEGPHTETEIKAVLDPAS